MNQANTRIGGIADPMDYIALLKPRVMWLVVFTAAVGMFSSPISLHPVLGFISLLCIAVGAGAAGCLNMWLEIKTDSLMARTRNRPLPAGRICPHEAVTFGVILAVSSVTLMGLGINATSALLLGVTIFYYTVIYTMWLKPRTEQNIVLGGVSGALPPVIGWAATGASLADPTPWVLFAVIFLWTPPHSWALAIFRITDYKAAVIPMMPSTPGGVMRACIWSIIYSVAMLALAVAVLVVQSDKWFFGTALFCGSALMVWKSIVMYRSCRQDSGDEKDGRAVARAFFRWSIWILFSIYASMLVQIML